MKSYPREEEKVFATPIPDKGWMARIYEKFLQINEQKNQLILEMDKRLTGPFGEKEKSHACIYDNMDKIRAFC